MVKMILTALNDRPQRRLESMVQSHLRRPQPRERLKHGQHNAPFEIYPESAHAASLSLPAQVPGIPKPKIPVQDSHHNLPTLLSLRLAALALAMHRVIIRVMPWR